MRATETTEAFSPPDFGNGSSFSNSSSSRASVSYPGLQTALNITLITLLVVIMLAMGSVVTWQEIRKHLRRPIGVLIGMTSQFVLLPLTGYGIANALQLTPYHAIGLLVLTCSPGGTTSNIFTYLSGGDVSLSIVMTSASTVLALGMMPVNLYLYSRTWVSETLTIPYQKIAITLILILIPVVVGMFLRWKFPKLATAVSKVGSTAGMLAILSTIIMQSILYPTIFVQSWAVWVAATLLPALGFTLGFVFSLLFRQESRLRRTIAFETGAQNVGLSLTVLLLSFPLEALEALSIIPILFSIFVNIEGFLFSFGFRLVSRLWPHDFDPIGKSDSTSSYEKTDDGLGEEKSAKKDLLSVAVS